MDIDADAAAVDLARTQLDELQGRFRQSGLLDGLRQPLERREGSGNGLGRVFYTWMHGRPPPRSMISFY
jgi:hypothetical protein